MDVRFPIGILFAGIGVLLIAAGLTTAPEELKLASTGFNLNLVWGGTTAQTPIDLGVNFPAAGLSTDLYELTLFSPRGKADMVLYNLERVGTSNVVSGIFANSTQGITMPANTLLLTLQTAWRTNNATLLAVGLDIAGFVNYADF